MRKILDRKYTILLVLILVFAVILRFVGTNPGYHPYHPDENTIYSTAVDYLKNKNFSPFRYEYPALANYINYIFFKLIFIQIGWLNFALTNLNKILDGQIKFPLGLDIYNRVFQLEILGSQDRNALFWGRYVTALFGVGVVYATYLAAKKLFNRLTGLLAAILVCVNFRQVLNSHFDLPDIYNAFFFLLSFWQIVYLREKVNLKRALIVAIFLGLYLSTKYQFFPFIPLFLVYLESSLKKETFREKILSLFNPYFIIVPIISFLIFLLLNPYLFINLGEAIKQIAYAALKYGAGAMHLTIYPYWYLFNIGVGKITSFLVIGGAILGIVKERWKTILLLSVIGPFFYFFTYYSGGGFYTRNFISIIPFLLIFAGRAIGEIIKFKPKMIFVSVALILSIVVVWENLANSLIVVREYTQPWNRTLVGMWLTNNVPLGAKVAAHSSVPLPEGRVRIDYDLFPWRYFSLAEFASGGATFAVANLDWVDSTFYTWMRSGDAWGKPLKEMRNSYEAMTINELTDFGLYAAVNPWQAPDSDFIAARVPYYKVISKKEFKKFSFDPAKSITTWQSEPLSVDAWRGFLVEYQMKLDSAVANYKDGFLFAKFYPNVDEATGADNYRAVRLSERDDTPGAWVKKEFMGIVPEGSKFVVLGFQVYDKNKGQFFLDQIKIFKADISEDLGGLTVEKIKIDDDILFPNSHANL